MKLRDYLVKKYWILNSILRHVIGSGIEERHFRNRESADVKLGFSNLVLPHREWVARRILNGAEKNLKILEVGCGWGPNLAVLSNIEPTLHLTGIDISPASILEGTKRLNELGFKNITLIEGSADNLNKIPTSSVDIVLSDAVLLYVGPDKINQVIKEMLRVARSKLIILEMHVDQGENPLDNYTKDGWLRDYIALFRPIVGEMSVRMEKIPFGLRSSGRWPLYGCIVEVDIIKE
jgi:ubiquinone/menaquinone biosynthesis C-methylase UbiE